MAWLARCGWGRRVLTGQLPQQLRGACRTSAPLLARRPPPSGPPRARGDGGNQPLRAGSAFADWPEDPEDDGDPFVEKDARPLDRRRSRGRPGGDPRGEPGRDEGDAPAPRARADRRRGARSEARRKDFEEGGDEDAPSEEGQQRGEHPVPGSLQQPDFLLGLSVRRHIAGYALLRFRDLLPLQFGLIDVRKAMEVQQKALEISAVLRDLRKGAPQKLMQAAEDAEEPEPGQQWRWVISVDDSTIDRAAPVNSQQNSAQRAIAMLQGLVIGDCRRIFKVAPSLLHPRLSRLSLGIRGRGAGARKDVYDLASARVPDFPSIRHPLSGTLNEDALLMSDAWAAARCAQRESRVAELRADAELVAEIRQQEMGKNKQLRRMSQAIAELYPRKASQELEKVLESRVKRIVDMTLHRMLDEEQRLEAEQSRRTGDE